MGIDLISSLDPTLRQIVRENTNKLKTKVLDVIYTDFEDLMQEATILPQMQVDTGKQGKDSDHYGVEVLPRTNQAPIAGALRERIKVQPFPESRIADFGFHLVDQSWSTLEREMCLAPCPCRNDWHRAHAGKRVRVTKVKSQTQGERRGIIL